jgi:hypothetical protein
VKTRTLLLLALACGVAIMAAGAVFLVQLSRQADAAPPVPLGEVTEVGDMRVVVDQSMEHDGLLDVTVTIGGVADADGAEGFRLIASGHAAVPDTTAAEGRCAETTVEPQRCTIRFDVSGANGDSRVLFYERGDERAHWVLD